MNKSIILVSLFVLIGMAASDVIPLSRSWLTSCKPCVNTLQECQDCIKGNCLQCVNEVDFSNCGKCATEIISVGDNLYCDGGIEYHRSVCQFSCRSRENISGFYKVGTCSASTGKCTCYLN